MRKAQNQHRTLNKGKRKLRKSTYMVLSMYLLDLREIGCLSGRVVFPVAVVFLAGETSAGWSKEESLLLPRLGSSFSSTFW